ncbi:MAG TPA: PEGA domain-containing protein [Candidatus Polarisedimenticolia bacterium]|nr:PEGA domain-containing protein [Candidatus Polarisedimenticolia bacterium]
MKKFGLLLVFAASLSCFGQLARPTVYIEPQQGFETYLAAAISKKNVPVDVMTDQTKANYVLKAAPVEIKTESTGGKIARCLFAYCAGIEDKGNVSVQLIATSSTKVMWAYSVAKQKGGSKNSQSMAEAVAKHLKDFVEHNSGKAILTAGVSDPPAAADNSQAEPRVESGPAMQLASVIVKSTPPGCDINVDGKYMGSTPSTIQLTPGEHEVLIEKDEMRPWQRAMTVTAGGSSTIDATLVKP